MKKKKLSLNEELSEMKRVMKKLLKEEGDFNLDKSEIYDEGPEDEEDDEPEICGSCNGSGEGMYDGSTCSSCKGRGVHPIERKYDDFDYDPDDEGDPSKREDREWGGIDW